MGALPGCLGGDGAERAHAQGSAAAGRREFVERLDWLPANAVEQRQHPAECDAGAVFALGEGTDGGLAEAERHALVVDVEAEQHRHPRASGPGLGLEAPAGADGVVFPPELGAQKALKNEAVLTRLAASGTQPIGAGPEAAAAHIRAETARWDRVLKAAGVQAN